MVSNPFSHYDRMYYYHSPTRGNRSSPTSEGNAVIFGEVWHRKDLPTRQLNQYSTGCKNKQKNIPISFNFLQRSSLQIFPAHANLKYLAKE